MAEEDDLIRNLYDLDKSLYDRGRAKKEIFSDLDDDSEMKTPVKLEAKEEEEEDYQMEEGEADFEYQALEEATAEYGSENLAEDSFGGCDDDLDWDMEQPEPDLEQQESGEEEEEAEEVQSGLQSTCKFRCKPCGLDFNTWRPTKKHIRNGFIGRYM